MKSGKSVMKSSEYHWKLFLYFGLAVVLVALVVMIFNIRFTGEVVVDFNEGDNSLTINLNHGELIPVDSDVLISSGGVDYNFKLSDLILVDSSFGDFYLQGSSVSGSGEGYGVAGSIVESPEIFFDLEVVTEVEVLDENDSVVRIDEEISIISGSVYADSDFEDSVSDGASVSIVSASVEVDESCEACDVGVGDLDLVVDSGNIVVSTDYSVSTEGFGEEFLTDDVLSLSIDLNEAGVNVSSGDISISVSSGGEEIFSFEKLAEDQVSVNETIDEDTGVVSNETENETEESPGSVVEENETIEEPIVEINDTDVGEVNETDNFTRVIVDIEEIPLVDYKFVEVNLSNEERQVLGDRFGFLSVYTYVYEYRDKFIVEYELGGYSMSNSYEESLDEATLSEIVKRDGSLWLRDLAREFLSSGENMLPREDLNVVVQY